MLNDLQTQFHPKEVLQRELEIDEPGNTKGGSITVPLTSCLTGLN
jgi:hypothetical protein